MSVKISCARCDKKFETRAIFRCMRLFYKNGQGQYGPLCPECRRVMDMPTPEVQ